MVSKQKAMAELKKYDPELTKLARWLRAVEVGRGFYPIVKLRNKGLIKERVISKGRMQGGVMVGVKKTDVLTEKGKRMLVALQTLMK